MMSKLNFVISFLTVINFISGQFIQEGPCNDNIATNIGGDFQIEAFSGSWFVIATSGSNLTDGQCSSAHFTHGNDTEHIIIQRTAVFNNLYKEHSFIASVDNGTGKFTVKSTDGFQTIISNYWILDTDYTSHALAYSCKNLPFNRRQVFSWKLSRTKQLTANATLAIDSKISSVPELHKDYFEPTDQSSEACFYYPEPELGKPVVFPGQCDHNITSVNNFNLTQYLGLWHEVASYPSTFQQGTCNNVEYTLNGSVVLVSNTQVVNQTLDIIDGIAVVTSVNGSAKLEVVFPIKGTNETITSNYWILDTDYTSYSLAYSCKNLPYNKRQVFSWKLSRSKQLTPNATHAIDSKISSIPGLQQDYFKPTDQSSEACFYYTEAELGKPVVFPGQCDHNITVVNNFNLTQYLGLWHEVASYPSTFQQGTCNNVEYTLNGSVVLVSNTQVVNQTLDIIDGIAVVTSVNGSAKLEVVFPIKGTNETITSNYWILDTDYTSYSLAYSCKNLPYNKRQVFSWKLSRSKQLTPNATHAIDSKISSIPELQQDYFKPTDQSSEACFYYTEAELGKPVLFPGQCDNNITVVNNFNLTQYLGLWHEVASYPSTFQQGTCNNVEYTLNGSVVLVSNTQVVNQTLDIIDGIAVVTSVNGSAKLEVIFPIKGTNETITSNYWILDTDYTSYSLAYSCKNLPYNKRQVFSWKLSRSKQLTPNATHAIDSKISSIPELQQDYFKPTDQSSEACFYYTEAELGKPVVFPGQCDNNITVVNNFNLTQYLGLWHEVASYPSTFQQGTCNNVEYTLNGSVVLVSNTQVVNQTLDIIDGIAVVTSVNGSAKLEVVFPIKGTNETITSNYWILDTDYTSYSLAYSCKNLPYNKRQVFSWKLSRSKQLTPNATHAIDSKISSIPELQQDYFKPTDQSSEACFYYTEAELGKPVVFPGQCDNNITVVNNFNLTQYLGLWHEVASYPSTFQQGTCNNVEYTLNGSVVLVSNTQVVNQTLDIIDGIAVVTSVNGSAKLEVVFPIKGTNETITSNYWILDTDYTSYSLAYSCKNLPYNKRQVFAWKLSRSKQLTPNATHAIDSKISSIPELQQDYFKPTDQSSEACFYYTEAELGKPVVFPGQCDHNITVVNNFNLTQYLGLWHEVASYPSTFQQGTCNNVEYTLNGSVVLVSNTQVVNQTLDIIDGIAVVTSVNGSAKLEVVFPIKGTNETITSNYWILDTDYTSYSLAYSCKNLPYNKRQVFSWKLSRSKQLTPNATHAIDSKISSIPELQQDYFKPTDQSSEACFYYTEAELGKPVVFPGQCDHNITVVNNFNLTQYLGLWHEVASYPSTFQQGTCNNVEYTLNGSVVLVSNTQVVNQTLDIIDGIAVVTSVNGSAKLEVVFPIKGTNETITSNYWILDTDYTSYSLAYSCKNLPYNKRQVFSWKLSRSKHLTPNATHAIDSKISSIPELQQDYFKPTDQSSEACFYYTEAELGKPVVFPGQCDNNITVVNNFNLTQYLGLWHEVASYPSTFQQGTCNNVEYTLNGSVVLVSNTQVVNQTLDIIDGIAVVTSVNGSAKLEVVFPIKGTNETITSNYWILDTDYTSYSLAYSCKNLPYNKRQVFSWKLSRSKQLTPNATHAIDSKISSIPELQQDYFKPTDQSSEACFYYTEAELGKPVVFPGQCDNNITVVNNFNLTQYLGLWHEVASYPSTFQQGTCNNVEYTLNGSVVLVSNTQVVNQTLDIIDGIAVVTSVNGSAKLEVVFPIKGTNETITSNYWILDTDYTSYSLAYSCKNLPYNKRQVFAWKLSRSKQLTPNATHAIDSKISSIPELQQDYFKPTDQSSEACFYYTEAELGKPVVFPGQCDHNITVVNNFNLTQYLGLWHEVASYPSTFQQGTCNNVEYTLNGSVVLVSNTQVVNQTLDIIDGIAVVTSVNGSAKLEVVFPIKGTNETITSNYWILDTDYTSYSLAYSCKNLPYNKRQVFSWKLSRSKQLTPNATHAIDSKISSIPELQQDYFKPTDQSSEACFYYTEAELGKPVVFPGQCDNNITVVNNFNLTQYLGLWHEVSSYPSTFKQGTCINNEYTLNGSVVLVSKTQVVNQTLGIIDGTAVLVNGSAKLDVIFPIKGTNETITSNYWILDTDYISYSLAYSCKNLPYNKRQVWSWKLSRSRTLTKEAENAINTVIDQVKVLNNSYFEDIDQSPYGCFYYPEVENKTVNFHG